MRIIAADDEKFALEALVDSIRKVKPDAEVAEFQIPDEITEYARKNIPDVAFLDIEMGSMSGIEIAKQLKIINPRVNIVFVTGYNEYMEQAIKLRSSGYVGKPVTQDKIREEFDNLRNPVEDDSKLLTVKCFGNFDAFVNGESLKFERNKTKELLAYLIDRRGRAVTSGEIRAVLWEDAESDKTTNAYFQILKKDLISALRNAGVENVLAMSWNKYAIRPELVSCDYYDYLDDKPDGVRAYNGEYMSQYSWGEIQNVIILDREKK